MRADKAGSLTKGVRSTPTEPLHEHDHGRALVVRRRSKAVASELWIGPRCAVLEPFAA
jgi:hypothetical protein